MTKKTRNPDRRLTKALLETADDMCRAGVMDAATAGKITGRHLRRRRAVEDLDDDTLKAIASSEVPAEYAALDDLVKDWKP